MNKWINLGKLTKIDSIFVYANTVDMIWCVAVILK